MRWLFRLIVLCLLIAPVVAVGLVAAFAFSDVPRTYAGGELTDEGIARAKRIVRENDPRTLAAGDVRSVSFTGEELNLIFRNLLRLVPRSTGELAIQDSALQLAGTIHLPDNPLGRFIHVDATFVNGPRLPALADLRVGRLAVPGCIARFLYRRALDLADGRLGHPIERGLIRQLAISGQSLALRYEWQPDLVDAARATLVDEALGGRVQAHWENLAVYSRTLPASGGAALGDFLGAALQFASTSTGAADAQRENRAAIIALEAYVNGRDLSLLVPGARSWKPPQRHSVVLQGREDFAQHFMLSAAMAVWGDEQLATAIGLRKEVEDSMGGSGFSFRDLAADRAGTRFGELAIRSRQSAAGLQRKIARGVRDEQLLPDLAGLPENLSESEFRRRFGEVGSPAYARISAEIDARLAALAIYR